MKNSKLAQMNNWNLRFVNLINLLHLRNYHFHSRNTVTKLAIMEVLQLFLLNISEAIPIAICSGLFSFNSYILGFHAFKQNWHPVLGRRYSCITEEKNEHDEYAVAVVNDDEVVGHIPLRLSKMMSMFLKLTDSHMEVERTGKYVNWGAGYKLEIPCKYHASGRESCGLGIKES